MYVLPIMLCILMQAFSFVPGCRVLVHEIFLFKECTDLRRSSVCRTQSLGNAYHPFKTSKLTISRVRFRPRISPD